MPSTVTVTVSFGDCGANANTNADDTAASATSAASASSLRRARLCPRCVRVTIYSSSYCRRCREDILREVEQMPTRCQVCCKREVKGDYAMCFPCYRKREAEKTKSCKCGAKIRADYFECFSCNTERKTHRASSSDVRPSDANDFPFIIVKDE
mmetsp:Transcript_11465/g.28959  ORF Transcript_11465/g.28959 Transcript_11465/m.28959 type:complete len:153 (-) Transcript_11465:350-808(-)